MTYERKTKDTFILLADYGQGWEEETEEESLKALKQQIKCYRENAPQYRYKAQIKRVPLNPFKKGSDKFKNSKKFKEYNKL